MLRVLRSAAPALCVGAFFACFYLATAGSDLRGNGDTLLRFQTTQSIVDHFQLWVYNPDVSGPRVVTGVGGHPYEYYAPGQTLFMVPFYIFGKFVAHHLSLPYGITTLYAAWTLDLWLGALLAIAFFLMCRALDLSLRTSIILTLIFGIATPAWPDALSGLEQTQVDLFLLLAVLFGWLFVKRGMRDRRWLILSGLAAGLGFFTRYDFALFVPLLALYPALLRWRTGERRQIVGDWIAFGSGVVPFVLAIGWWDYARFGSPFDMGLKTPTFFEPPWISLPGLLVSPGKGIVWYMPEVFLLPWAARRFVRQWPSLTLLFAAIVVVTFGFYSLVLYWHGDPAWGPRYLYVALPYLILPLGTLLESWSRDPRILRLALVGLVAASAVFQASDVSVNQWRFWYRLEVAEARTSAPFLWGPTEYHYYWDVGESPILVQMDNVYQVGKLIFLGDQRYRLTAPPNGTRTSNPADFYPINTFAFWWADSFHAIMGARTRAAIAVFLAIGAAIFLGLLLCLMTLMPSRRRIVSGSSEAVSGAAS